jgi:hypothetical protein
MPKDFLRCGGCRWRNRAISLGFHAGDAVVGPVPGVPACWRCVVPPSLLPNPSRLIVPAFTAALLSIGCSAAAAAPLGHKGSVIVSGEYDPHWSALTVTPTLTRSTGVGVNLNWMEPAEAGNAHGGSHRQELWSLVTLTQRLHRWNGDDHQANLWAGVGAGVLTTPSGGHGEHNGHGEASTGGGGSGGGTRAAWSPWVQADWETQRLYLAASARWFQAGEIGRLMTSARAGVALTPASYDRWQPWLMVEARTMEGLQPGVEITPLARVVHRRVLPEAGISTNGSLRFNLAYTF